MCNEGWINFTVVKSEKRPIAFHFGFVFNKRFIWYKPSFDIDLFKYYPGEVLLKELLEYAVDKKYNEFDFTIGSDFFKKRFANKVRQNFSYKIFKTRNKALLSVIVVFLKKNNCGKKVLKFALWIVSLNEKVRSLVKEYGLKKGCHIIIKSVSYRIFCFNCTYYYLIKRKELPSGKANLTVDNLTFREVFINDLIEFDYYKKKYRSNIALVRDFERIKKGKKCYAVFYFNDIVALAWVSTEKNIFISEVETRMRVEGDSVVIFDCTTIPEYRGKHVYGYVLRKLVQKYKNKNKIIYSDKRNIYSRKGIEQIFRLATKLYMIKIFGIKLRWKRHVI
jgi:hypothetical protein